MYSAFSLLTSHKSHSDNMSAKQENWPFTIKHDPKYGHFMVTNKYNKPKYFRLRLSDEVCFELSIEVKSELERYLSRV